MQVEIITVGTEVLTGETLNGNARYLGERLWSLGVGISRQVTVGDRVEDVASAVQEAVTRADLLILTGGLGPTEDDLTREGVALALGLALTEDGRLRQDLTGCGLRGVGLSRQATVIAGAELLANAWGTAPGLLLRREDKTLLLLPGPPREMQPLFELAVERGLLRQREKLVDVSLRICGISEAEVEERLRETGEILGQSNPRVAPYVGKGEVRLRIVAAGDDGERLAAATEGRIRSLFGHRLYGKGETSLEAVIGAELVRRGLRLAAAESCTGGLVAHRLTNVPGASEYLLASWVAYTRAAKEKFLGVPPGLLEEEGAVSATVAGSMAELARKLAGADLGVATTGLAGPGGGTAETPVGTVYLALASVGGTEVKREFFRGEREEVKFKAAQKLLVQLWDWLMAN